MSASAGPEKVAFEYRNPSSADRAEPINQIVPSLVNAVPPAPNNHNGKHRFHLTCKNDKSFPQTDFVKIKYGLQSFISIDGDSRPVVQSADPPPMADAKLSAAAFVSNAIAVAAQHANTVTPFHPCRTICDLCRSEL